MYKRDRTTDKIDIQTYFDEIFKTRNKKEDIEVMDSIEKTVEQEYFLIVQLGENFNEEQIKFLFLSNCTQNIIIFRNKLNSGKEYTYLKEAYKQYCYFKLFCKIKNQSKHI